jgi:hypothetical protein
LKKARALRVKHTLVRDERSPQADIQYLCHLEGHDPLRHASNAMVPGVLSLPGGTRMALA